MELFIFEDPIAENYAFLYNIALAPSIKMPGEYSINNNGNFR